MSFFDSFHERDRLIGKEIDETSPCFEIDCAFDSAKAASTRNECFERIERGVEEIEFFDAKFRSNGDRGSKIFDVDEIEENIGIDCNALEATYVHTFGKEGALLEAEPERIFVDMFARYDDIVSLKLMFKLVVEELLRCKDDEKEHE